MRRSTTLASGLVLGALLFGPDLFGQAPGFGFTPPPGIVLQDEGADQGRIRKLNCTGAGATCSASAGVGTINVTSGGGGGNFVETEVDFGAAGDTSVPKVITGEAAVTATSKIICNVTAFSTADRADGAEDAAIEQLTVAAHTRVAGTGFSVTVAPAQGRAYGKYKVHCAYS